jgi:ASPIC and UnbV/FG-GAP-like repeat/Ig-like domain CHU_C associated
MRLDGRMYCRIICLVHLCALRDVITYMFRINTIIMRLTLLLSLLTAASASWAQISFTPAPVNTLPGPHYSGVAIAVLDMNGDGRDDIARLAMGTQLNVAYQTTPNAPFSSMVSLGSFGNGSQWGMCAADINNDGLGDVLAGGYYDGIKIAVANADGSAFIVNNLPQPGTFTQCVNMFDVNNDGWLDAFVCHDDGVSRIFGNNADGTYTYQAGWIDLSTSPASDNSGNYGSVFSDVNNDGLTDLYIAKCRQGANSSTDPRRINQLFINNGDGTFTQDITNTSGLRIGAQSWTADFGDVDNDGDFDCFITNHDVSSQLLLNDGSGHFNDVTQAAGLQDAVTGLPIQGVFVDFDNDRYVDIVVAGTQHQLFRNNGDGTFTEVSNFMTGPQMGSYAIGDLNYDGYQDIYACYQNIYTDPSNTPDELWFNNGSTNHFIGFNLRGINSNRSAVGAKATIHTPQGIQVREVRSGQSYGISNSLQLHFGLGDLTVVDSVVIQWPSGAVDVVPSPAVDTYNNVSEGGCLIGSVAITSAGAPVICTGGAPLQINAPDGFNYLWSTGDTTQNITVSTGGTYKVTVSVPNTTCTVTSNAIVVVADPIEIPSISIEGELEFCKGGSVILTSSPAAAYTWTNGATTQSITVTESGDYAVTTQGTCADFSSLFAIPVVAIDPELPVTTSDVTNIGGFAILKAEGDTLLWYDAPTGGALVFSGDSLYLPIVNQTTTYWVENLLIQDQPNAFGGMAEHAGTNFSSSSTNGQVIFDVLEPFNLKSVKVYTNTAGLRKIDLLDATGTLLDSRTVTIPAGTTQIELNMPIPAGQDMVLTTDISVNQANLGTNGPILRRADTGVLYPYEVPGVLSIKGSNFGEARYYYFFNWEIDFPGFNCASDRVPVTATVDSFSSVWTLDPAQLIQIAPNPTRATVISTTWPEGSSGLADLTITNTLGQIIRAHQVVLQAGQNPLDLSGLTAGGYVIRWRNTSGTWLARVIVQE